MPVPVTRVTGDTRVQTHTADLVTSAWSCTNSPNRIHVSSRGLTVHEAGRRHEFGAIGVAGGDGSRACATGNPQSAILPSSKSRNFVLLLVFGPQSYHLSIYGTTAPSCPSDLPSIHIWHYSPFMTLVSLTRRLHSSLPSVLPFHPLIPSSCNASLRTTSAHLVLGLPTALWSVEVSV